jgi:hypothetical protein
VLGAGLRSWSGGVRDRHHAGGSVWRRRFKVFATDADSKALVNARTGRLRKSIFEYVPATAYIDRDQGGIKIRHAIRELMLFAKHDLLCDSPISRLDLIRCGRFFTELEGAMKARLIKLFHYILNPRGYLWLDYVDTIDGLDEHFEILDERVPLLRRKACEQPFTRDLFAFGGLEQRFNERRAEGTAVQHQLHCDVEELRTLNEQLTATFEASELTSLQSTCQMHVGPEVIFASSRSLQPIPTRRLSPRRALAPVCRGLFRGYPKATAASAMKIKPRSQRSFAITLYFRATIC